jgi:hypothetical protein
MRWFCTLRAVELVSSVLLDAEPRTNCAVRGTGRDGRGIREPTIERRTVVDIFTTVIAMYQYLFCSRMLGVVLQWPRRTIGSPTVEGKEYQKQQP